MNPMLWHGFIYPEKNKDTVKKKTLIFFFLSTLSDMGGMVGYGEGYS